MKNLGLSLSCVFVLCFSIHVKAQIITTVAGTGIAGYSGDGGPATIAKLSNPGFVAVDKQGNLYIVDGNNCIRKVDPAGIISTIAGTGVSGFSGDGFPATAAQLNSPKCLCLDTAGNIYFADYGNNRIRKIDHAGIITTVAGNGIAGYSGDGIPALTAELQGPYSVAEDCAGNISIADALNHRIRQVLFDHEPYFMSGHSQNMVICKDTPLVVINACGIRLRYTAAGNMECGNATNAWNTGSSL
jgi:NHL repeat